MQQLLPVLENFDGELLVLNGDVPLLRPETVESLVQRHRSSNADVTLLTARLDDPTGYGRVFADENGRVSGIVEHRDCSEEQRSNNLTNAGIYCFNWGRLAAVLPQLSTDNDQGELYSRHGCMLSNAVHFEVSDPAEGMASTNANNWPTRSLLQQRSGPLDGPGVTFVDPLCCTLSEDCNFGRDVLIEPQTHLRGNCQIGDNCRLGPGSLIEEAKLGVSVEVVHSVVRGAVVGDAVSIGPFAHLRPAAEIGKGCRIGNFVEVKKSRLGDGSKVNHLSYIGDSQLGDQVNVGAGTITANTTASANIKPLLVITARPGQIRCWWPPSRLAAR